MKYDLVIIGGGPAGLALAQCAIKSNKKKILIIERENDIGGCHRVRQIDGLMTEHGPRVYSSAYKVFQTLLNDMNLDFYNLFKEYNFSISHIGNETLLSILTFKEKFHLFSSFIFYMINSNYGKNITMLNYMKNYNFTFKSYDVIDRLCRLTDGASSDNYDLYKFLQLINQQFLYKLYQPIQPNNIGLFTKWKSYLIENNVDILLNSTVDKINIVNNKVISVNQNNEEIFGDVFVLATPPASFIDLLNDQTINTFTDNFKEFVEKTNYNNYISIIFHWDIKLQLNLVYGFPKSDWGLAFIVLSDYMKFDTSKTVISTAITIPNYKSITLNKSANQCTKDEIIKEAFNQLKQSFPNLPDPTHAKISSGDYYKDDQWNTIDKAFISTNLYLPFKSKTILNLYNLGTQNGKHIYQFTSLESAVTNAVYLSHILYPELKNKFKISYGYTIRFIFISFIILILVLFLILLI